MQEERDRLVQERDNAKGDSNRYRYIINTLFSPYAKKKSLYFDDRTSETLGFVLSPLLHDAMQAGMLRDQVQILQQEVLARKKKTHTISDEQFARDFHKLAALIKTLSRVVCPHEGVDVSEILGSGILTIGTACHHWRGRAGSKLFIEAWIWSILIQELFQNPFAIFGIASEGIFMLWSDMFRAQHYREWPQPSHTCETWRRTTMEQLVAIVDKDVFTRPEAKDSYQSLEKHAMITRTNILDAIQTRVALIAPMADSFQVRQIVDEAFTLAMHMSLQQSRLQLTFPKIGARFSETEMRSLSSLSDEEGFEAGVVNAVINPGLTKWGDVHGRNLDHRYDIVPTLVQLHVPLLKNET
ncbi:hypothetical protein IQ07DRAFT_525629 [Pyrenochaeta sp. DS3sAY3a]|nr:hypothetical protein IQ07DRAFT_525629 [Pyrenochaeta sp. DS3sAY3a]